MSALEPSGVQTCDFCNQPTTRPYVGRDEEADVDVVSCAPCAVAMGEAPSLLLDAVSYRERVVLKARHAGQTSDGVAAGLGVSKARVEQIEAQAQAKIVEACLGQIPCKPDDDWTLPTPPSDTGGGFVSGLEPSGPSEEVMKAAESLPAEWLLTLALTEAEIDGLHQWSAGKREADPCGDACATCSAREKLAGALALIDSLRSSSPGGERIGGPKCIGKLYADGDRLFVANDQFPDRLDAVVLASPGGDEAEE